MSAPVSASPAAACSAVAPEPSRSRRVSTKRGGEGMRCSQVATGPRA